MVSAKGRLRPAISTDPATLFLLNEMEAVAVRTLTPVPVSSKTAGGTDSLVASVAVSRCRK